MRTKGMFMLDLLSNAVGANLILLFLFIAMTGAEPPRGSRPLGGPPRQPALFLEVTIEDALAEVDYALFPPATANDATYRLLKRNGVTGPSRALFVPRLRPGCWRLAMEYVGDPRGFTAPRQRLAVTVWLSGLRPLVNDGELLDSTTGRIDMIWPQEPTTAAAEADHTMFVKQELDLDPNVKSILDLYFLEEGTDLPANGGCAAVPGGALSPGGLRP